MKPHNEARAAEYDNAWLGRGLYAYRRGPDWDREVAELTRLLANLEPAHTLDVACGTGFLTQHLRGEIVALDQSETMLDIARKRLPSALVVRGDALSLPFDDGAFDRLLTSFFYGRLSEFVRLRFLREAWRVARELIVVEGALRPHVAPVRSEERALKDGSGRRVFKRYFDRSALIDELGGGDVLFAGDWFIVARSSCEPGRFEAAA
jgi:SAM-dependent methyltransferase